MLMLVTAALESASSLYSMEHKMALYQIIKLDDPDNESGAGTFVGMAQIDSDLDVIGRYGTGEGFGADGILYHWAPEPGFIAVKHPVGKNQPKQGAPYPASIENE